MFSEDEIAKLETAGNLILAAEDRLPVLRTVSWSRDLADKFIGTGAREMPRPDYTAIDPAPSLEPLEKARALIDGSSEVHDWLRGMATKVEVTARMLAAVGTKDFYAYSKELYGAPDMPLADGKSTALGLARQLEQILSEYSEGCFHMDGAAPVLTAHELKEKIEAQLPEHFGDEAPAILVTSDVSAKAAAGSDYIKVREDALFSDLDVIQLLHHEALVHIATNINGAHQPRFSILKESYPGNARTQEGLAVFAEFMSGAIDPVRFQRLAQRAIAIDMAANGADFIQLYEYFLENSRRDDPFEAFESARRVVRGGLVTGGAPLTKDGVYLGGLIDIHTYLRSVVRRGDPELIRLLFVGKFDLGDVPAISLMLQEGLLVPAKILPPWAKDLRFLLAYLSYSSFLNQIDQATAEAQIVEALDNMETAPEARGRKGRKWWPFGRG